eukprot:UN03860
MFQCRGGIFFQMIYKSSKIMIQKEQLIYCQGTANFMSHFANLFIVGRGYCSPHNKFYIRTLHDIHIKNT